MHLIDVRVTESGVYPDFRRVEARIALQSTGRVFSFGFDFPADLEPDLTDNGNAWVLLMLPLASYYGEDIQIDRPVDGLFLENLLGVQRLWKSWYPELHVVDIKPAAILPRAASDRPGKVIACFSGGVDSLFTFNRHRDRLLGNGHGLIDELLCIGGLMTSMADIGTLRQDFERVAGETGHRLIPIVMDFRYGAKDGPNPYTVGFGEWWEKLTHGVAIATPVHLFDKRYKELLIPASIDISTIAPWGSHPLSDPLLSSSGLSIVHDGIIFSRFERTAAIAKIEDALQILHVCGQDRRLGNCSRCEKCLRTMTSLDLLGARARAKTFDWSDFSLRTISRIWLGENAYRAESKAIEWDIIQREASALGRQDVVEAIASMLRYSRAKRRTLWIVKSNPLSATAWAVIRSLRDALRKRQARPAALSPG